MIKNQDSSSEGSEEEDMTKDIFSFQIEESRISIHYYQLCKYSELIRNNYLFINLNNIFLNKLLKFQRNSKVSSNNIELYFKSLQEDRFTITNDNFVDFYKISKFLKSRIILKKLQKYLKKHSKDVDFVITILSQRGNFNENDECISDLLVNAESLLSENLNESIQNQKFGYLSIETIYRIIEKNEKELDHNLLYSFICDSISDRFILLRFLNLSKVTDEKVDELCQKYQRNRKSGHFEYLNCNVEEISSLRSQLREERKKYSDLEIEYRKVCQERDSLRLENEQLTTEKQNIEQELKKLKLKIERDSNSEEDFIRSLNLILGNKTESNLNSAKAYLERSSSKGNSNASYLLGLCYEEGTLSEKDFDKATSFFELSNSQGNSYGNIRIGLCYLSGLGTEKDHKKAFSYFSKELEKGNKTALSYIGTCYLAGAGVAKDVNSAVDCFKKSYKNGDLRGMFFLAQCFENGVGVDKNMKLALKIYRKLEVVPFAPALCALGRFSLNGIEEPVDNSKAVDYFKKALDLGFYPALTFLGGCYEKGIGVQKDVKTALDYYKKANNFGINAY